MYLKKFLLILFFLTLLIPISWATTYTVINCNDSGAGSLRQAIINANGNSGPDLIAFQIPTTEASTEVIGATTIYWWHIEAASGMPAITPEAIHIDGTTQRTMTNEACPGNPFGPLIEVSGYSAGTAIGLDIQTAYCTIEGLVLNGWGSQNGSYGAIWITGPAAHHNRIISNYIGPTVSGETYNFINYGANARGVYIEDYAHHNELGGSLGGIAPAGEGNLISGNSNGVGISNNAQYNEVKGNYIGTDRHGTADLGNSSDNVMILNSHYNIIGGATAAERNIISGANSDYGIYIQSYSSSNEVMGNYIGTDKHGTAAIPNNQYGIQLAYDAHHNKIGGSISGQGNLISGNGSSGINFYDAQSNEVKGNYIGTDKNGTTDLPNYIGVQITATTSPGYESCDNIIGGATPAERNLLSGNSQYGLRLTTTNVHNNQVIGNYIGTDKNGTTYISNGWGGLHIDASAGGTVHHNSIIGNVISGNWPENIKIYKTGATSNEIKGNYIGTDAYGTASIGISNGNAGITIDEGSSYNIIGGSTEAERNIVSGIPYDSGIIIKDSSSNEVKGNYIGTDKYGTAAIPNQKGLAIYINSSGSYDNKIGGDTSAEGNVISGNEQNGIYISGSSTSGTIIKSNYIGTNQNGQNLGNGYNTSFPSHGIYLLNNSNNTQIGPHNLIAYNSREGIRISSGCSYEVITQNSIYSNIGKGISLEAGANFDLPYPNIISVIFGAGSDVTITGESVANAVIEIFKVEDPPDPSGYGEGKDYLGSTEANASGSWIATVEGLVEGDVVTATATLYLSPGYTSDFALNSNVIGPYTVTTTADAGIGSLRQAIQNANSAAGTNPITIKFDITSEAFTEGSASFWSIKPQIPLPTISRQNIIIDGATQPTAEGNNPFGPEIEIDGSQAGIAHGLSIEASNCTVKGLVINNFSNTNQAGIYIKGVNTQYNQISGNYLGTNVTGEAAKPNYYGVYIYNDNLFYKVHYNIIGGTTEADKNIISGNTSHGVRIEGTDTNSNEVMGNYIGLDRNGTTTLGNGGSGVYLATGVKYNLIGGTTAESRNIISGNNRGVFIFGYNAERNKIRGNYIGTDRYGTVDLGNTLAGVHTNQYPTYNLIGGTTPGERNVISGNGDNGIYIYCSSTEVKGNYIGTDSFGTAALGNTGAGIRLEGNSAIDNLIGGVTLAERNIISGNSSNGIYISGGTGTGAINNKIQGNFIGINHDGTGAISNEGYGIRTNINCNGTEIGPYNSIAYNLFGGIRVGPPSGGSSNVLITRNSMEVSGKGIYLDSGANNDIPYPTVTSAQYDSGTTTITGTAAVGAIVEVFKTEDPPDTSGQGAGWIYLGSIEANASTGTWEITSGTLNQGDKVTATATKYSAGAGYTSEFAFNGSVEGMSITLLIPNGGEIWRATSTHDISWETTGFPSAIRISYSTDNGNNYTLITTEADTGSYSWTVANAPTTEAKIKVEALGSIATDESDAVFEITSPDIFTVITTAETGNGSLYQAILDANAIPGRQTIRFNIPTNEAIYDSLYSAWLWSIRVDNVSTAMDVITEEVHIDGTSQPTDETYYNPNGPNIELRKQPGWAVKVDGLHIETSNCTIEGIIIRDFDQDDSGDYGNGIYIGGSGSNNNRIIGTHLLNNQSNGIMIDDQAQNNIIGGTTAAERNLLSNNGEAGVCLRGLNTNSNEVKGNYIGTDINGTAAYANSSYGVYIYEGAKYNVIGGSTATERNIISGNYGPGVRIEEAETRHNRVKGNYIGTDVNGTTAISNSGKGVSLNAPENIIGGTTAGDGNVISGNAQDGVYIYYTTSNEVKGNYIGTDRYGTAAISNEAHGVHINFLSNFNTVGGSTAAERNIISGNENYGVLINVVSTTNEVKGNYIGTNIDASAALPNGFGGVYINNSRFNTIGGNTANEGNIISGNGFGGVAISDSSSSGNKIKNNIIGTNSGGTTDLGNSGPGVYLYSNANHNQVGPDNTIAYNNASGIWVAPTSSYEVITENSMYENVGKGITLETGANNNIAAPVITAANYSGGTTTIEGTASANATVEVFKTEDNVDEFGQGEGKVYLGTTQANGSGNWSIAVSGLYISDKVTATSTDTDNTSEFSLNATAEAASPEAAAAITISVSREGNNLIIAWITSPEGSAVDVYRIDSNDAGANIYTNEVSAWTRIITNETFSSTRETNQIGGGFAQAYYKVISAGQAELFSTAEAVGKFNKAVAVGLSLFSVPILPTDTDINVALGDQLSNNDIIYYFTGTAWQDSTTNGTTWTGGVTNIYPDLGYWVRVQTTPSTVTVWGNVSSAASREVSLASGLNLKGTAYPIRVTLEDSDLGAALSYGSGADTGTLYYFTGSAWQDSSWNGTSWYNKGISYFYPTRGYWIRRNNAAGSTWYYPKLY